jgi:hypothetical protein
MPESLLTRPAAIAPIAMSAVALAVCIGYALLFGTARQADEGTAAHLWQLLMAGQLPFIAFFAIRYVPAAPGRGVMILFVQFVAALAAMFPVWWFNW